jgi:hypothetical protein
MRRRRRRRRRSARLGGTSRLDTERGFFLSFFFFFSIKYILEAIFAAFMPIGGWQKPEKKHDTCTLVLD